MVWASVIDEFRRSLMPPPSNTQLGESELFYANVVSTVCRFGHAAAILCTPHLHRKLVFVTKNPKLVANTEPKAKAYAPKSPELKNTPHSKHWPEALATLAFKPCRGVP